MLQNELAMRFMKLIKPSDGDFYAGTIDVVHQKLHQGQVFIASKIYTSVANDAYADIRIVTDATKEAHLELFIGTEGKAYAYSYSGTTYSNNGTLLDCLNRNMASDKVATVKAYHTPTINVLGTKRFEQLMGGGTNNNNQIAGSISERAETVIKVNSEILIRVQNKAGSAKDISIYALWYEED